MRCAKAAPTPPAIDLKKSVEEGIRNIPNDEGDDIDNIKEVVSASGTSKNCIKYISKFNKFLK